MQNSTELEQIGNIYSKRIFLVHIITNNQQMANKLLHVLFPYKVSKNNTAPKINYTYLVFQIVDDLVQCINFMLMIL